MIQTVNDALRRITAGDFNQRLASFLLSQHATLCATTARSPAELFMNRRMKAASTAYTLICHLNAKGRLMITRPQLSHAYWTTTNQFWSRTSSQAKSGPRNSPPVRPPTKRRRAMERSYIATSATSLSMTSETQIQRKQD
ncbi:hypothetical protein M514_24298 [Trichuris suis]|uniref:Uncharacterized protein n=1 Tax=Trichuris suis TaxID=68888 RepID=A0A085N1Z3_9BILA|nr:hypothetical protein M514_24298 [Trichuris suis]